MIVKFCQNQKWTIIVHFPLNLSNGPMNLMVLSFPSPQTLEVLSSKLRRGYAVAFSMSQSQHCCHLLHRSIITDI